MAPSWRTDAAGTPTKFIKLPNNKILLHPAPSAACISAGNSFISGTVFPDDIDSTQTTLTCQLPVELHEPLCKITAVRSADPNRTEPHQFQRLQDMEGKAWSQVAKVGKRNKNDMASWGTTSGWTGDGFLRM